jgi:hypothetical protein
MCFSVYLLENRKYVLYWDQGPHSTRGHVTIPCHLSHLERYDVQGGYKGVLKERRVEQGGYEGVLKDRLTCKEYMRVSSRSPDSSSGNHARAQVTLSLPEPHRASVRRRRT